MFATRTIARRWMRTVVLVAPFIWAREARAQFLSASGSPAKMTVQAATAGFAPTPVTDASTTYTVFTNGSGHHKITAQINSAMPAGVTLDVTLAAPAGASSAGAVTLGTTPHDVVTGIPNTFTTRAITYQLTATAAAGVVSTQSRIVTLTLVATP